MLLEHQKLDYKEKCLIEKVTIKAPFRHAINFHNEACFIFFLQGRTTVNSANEEVKVKEKEGLVLKCGNYVSNFQLYNESSKYEIIVIHLYPGMLRSIYGEEIPSFLKKPVNKAFISKMESIDLISRFIENFTYYFKNPSLATDDLLELKVKELILLLIQTNNADNIVGLFNDLFSPRTINIREVIDTHLFSDLSIEDLALLSNQSVSAFKRSFRDIFNDSPANYIRKKRLEKAYELLTVSTLPINEIAFRCCYHDSAHFSRVFKATYHLSPSDYRKANKTE